MFGSWLHICVVSNFSVLYIKQSDVLISSKISVNEALIQESDVEESVCLVFASSRKHIHGTTSEFGYFDFSSYPFTWIHSTHNTCTSVIIFVYVEWAVKWREQQPNEWWKINNGEKKRMESTMICNWSENEWVDSLERSNTKKDKKKGEDFAFSNEMKKNYSIFFFVSFIPYIV